MRVTLVLGMSAGGVGRHVQGLAAGLVERGHTVVVAAPAEVERRFDLTRTGALVRPVEIAERPHPARDVKAVRALRATMRDSDVVHAHGVRAGALACLAAVRTHVPVVVTLHNAAPAGRVTGRIHAALERVVARRAAVVLGVSRDLVDRMDRLGAARTALAVVSAPPVPLASRSATDVRRALGVKHCLALGVVVARLAHQKGLDVLLDATGRLRDLDVLVVVAGDGPLQDRLQARIDAEGLPVRLLGRREDVPDLLAAADVVISSARWEGQPIGLQEALLVGAPIVATDAGGTADTIHSAAILVPVGDAEALAGGIRTVLTDPGERAALAERARDAARRLPTDADAVEAALSAYRDATPA